MFNETDDNEFMELECCYRRSIGDDTSFHQERLRGEGPDYLPKVLDTLTRLIHGMGFDYVTHLTAHTKTRDITGDIYNG